MEITRNRDTRTISLSQNQYLNNILERFNKSNLNPVISPSEPGIKLEKNTLQASNQDINYYQQQIGSLIYLATKTRPDIAYQVNNCARFMSNPNKSHYSALERIWKYLVNKKYNLVFRTKQSVLPISNNFKLIGYVDADWGGDLVNRKSTTGYIFTINNTPISWSSKLQKSVALSSCEAEYMALKEAVKEFIYLINILKSLDIHKDNSSYYLFSDNQSAIKLAKNPEYHSKSKHIDIQYHYVREKILEGIIDLNYINTKDQPADIFTKSLNTNTFKDALRFLNLEDVKSLE